MADSLQEARLAVMSQVAYVQKTKPKTGSLPYTFASESAVIAALRPAMIAEKITMTPGPVEHITSEEWTSKEGKRTGCMVIKRTYIFRFQRTDGTVEQDVVEVLGEGGDNGDKRASKALTMARKYALREYFLIETGDDPDEVMVERSEAVEAAGYMTHKFQQNLKSATTPEELATRWTKVTENRTVLTTRGFEELEALHSKLTKQLTAKTQPDTPKRDKTKLDAT